MRAGFTLLEALVALLLTALLSAALAASLRLGGRIWEAVDPRRQADPGVVQALLRRQLTQAVPFRLGDAGFVGAAERASFVAPAPADAAPPGFHRITIERRGDGLRLLWIAVDAAPGVATADELLLEGVRGVVFSYLAEDGWRGAWTDTRTLPRAVRLEVEFEDGDRAWPPLVARPMATVPALL